jgi:hypothetical protein
MWRCSSSASAIKLPTCGTAPCLTEMAIRGEGSTATATANSTHCASTKPCFDGRMDRMLLLLEHLLFWIRRDLLDGFWNLYWNTTPRPYSSSLLLTATPKKSPPSVFRIPIHELVPCQYNPTFYCLLTAPELPAGNVDL